MSRESVLTNHNHGYYLFGPKHVPNIKYYLMKSSGRGTAVSPILHARKARLGRDEFLAQDHMVGQGSSTGHLALGSTCLSLMLSCLHWPGVVES